MELSSDDLKRFWEKVNRKSHSECWEWTASKRHFGYGQLSIRNKPYPAHRLSWIIHHGTIQPGKSVCHTCDNPSCVNPAHLFLGTHAENVADMNAKGRHVPARKGTENPLAVLSPDLVVKIRELLSQGHSTRMVGKMIGVSHTAISRIKRGVTWRHVE